MSIFLGLGSNIGNRLFYLKQSLIYLQSEYLVEVKKVSRLYLTEPEGLEHEKSPGSFLNLVCQVETKLTAQELLRACLEIENRLGRKREQPSLDNLLNLSNNLSSNLSNNPQYKKSSRKIDIDLLYFRDLVLKTEELTIPHPRAKKRAFVLFPLAEIVDFNWRDPVEKLEIETLKKKLVNSPSFKVDPKNKLTKI